MEKQISYKSSIKKIVISGIIGLVFAWIMCTFICRPIQVQGISMLPNYTEGEIKLIKKFDKSYGYNDVVVVSANGGYIIKRIIGVGGETIAIDNVSGQVIRNNQRINEEYLSENNQTRASSKDKKTTSYLETIGASP